MIAALSVQRRDDVGHLVVVCAHRARAGLMTAAVNDARIQNGMGPEIEWAGDVV